MEKPRQDRLMSLYWFFLLGRIITQEYPQLKRIFQQRLIKAIYSGSCSQDRASEKAKKNINFLYLPLYVGQKFNATYKKTTLVLLEEK